MATRVPDPLVTSHRLIWSSATAEGKTKVHVRFVSSKHVTPVWSHLAQTSWLTAVTILTPLHCQPPSGSRWKSDSYSIKLTSSKIIFSDVFKNIIYKNSRKEERSCCCFLSTEKQGFKRSKLSMSSSPPPSSKRREEKKRKHERWRKEEDVDRWIVKSSQTIFA